MLKFTEWLGKQCADGKPKSPRGMVKVSHKEKISGGTRDMTDDLSSDYKGHIAHNGEVAPFKVMGKVSESTVCPCNCNHCKDSCCGGKPCCDKCICCK